MSPTTLQADVASLIIENTRKVFSVMLKTDVSEPSSIVHDDASGPEGDVVSLVGFVGQWTGTGGVCCNAQVACRISGLMLMNEFDAVNEDVLDAMGETTNMIIGNLKDALEPTLGRLGLSTPTVIYGEHLKARSLNGERWTTVSFACMGGILNVKVSLRPTAEGQADTNNHRA